MLGVATLIVVMAVMNGFRAELISKILGVNGHVIVEPIDTKLTDYSEVAARIAAVPGVKAALPLVEGQVLANGGTQSTGALVRGVREQDLPYVPGISGHVVLGTFENFDSSGGVAVGSRLAANLGLTIGSKITIVSPNGTITPIGVTPRLKSYPVVAIFEIGMSEYDSLFVLMPFPEAQIYFNAPDRATAIEVYLNDPDKVGELKPLIEEAAGRQALHHRLAAAQHHLLFRARG